MKDRCVQIFDSLGGRHTDKCETIVRYLGDQYKRLHCGEELPGAKDWKYGATVQTPAPLQGEETFDCGVFVCLFVDFLQLNLSFQFKQSDIVHHGRTWIGSSILANKILF